MVCKKTQKQQAIQPQPSPNDKITMYQLHYYVFQHILSFPICQIQSGLLYGFGCQASSQNNHSQPTEMRA